MRKKENNKKQKTLEIQGDWTMTWMSNPSLAFRVEEGNPDPIKLEFLSTSVLRTGYNQTCPSVHLGSDPVKGSYSWEGGSRGKGCYFYHEDQKNAKAERAL